ncbi:hypothetical protein ACIQGZ_17220 [Streptomyces sp. NPDC092296]|uniref:hypothetical protein n=1 Tax=Streptomyces sp. NPDC092296 TaxID=3366012 RepID=UPI003815A3AE
MTDHPAVTAYEKAIAGIPDCFDHLTTDSIRGAAVIAVESGRTPGTTVALEADRFVRAHLGMLDTWHDALDALDSELRGDTVAGGLPDDQILYLKTQALDLFEATTSLLRATATYHHGSAGPALDPEYGHAYALSCSALQPF